VAGAERLFAPRRAIAVKPLGSDSIGGGGDSPLTYRAARYRHDCSTVARITSAAAGIVSTCADERFFRGVEPERSPSHIAVAWQRAAGQMNRLYSDLQKRG